MCRDIGFQRAFHPQSGSRHPAYHHCCNDDYPVQIDPGHITENIQESGPFSGFEISPYNRRLTFIVLRACDLSIADSQNYKCGPAVLTLARENLRQSGYRLDPTYTNKRERTAAKRNTLRAVCPNVRFNALPSSVSNSRVV